MSPADHSDHAEGTPGGPVWLVGATALVVLPAVLIGILGGASWSSAGPNYYSVVSQIIATLFVATAIEYLLADESTLAEVSNRWSAGILLLLSWSGLFACTRALADDGNAVLAGTATGGLAAASALVGMTFFAKMQAESGPTTAALFLLLFYVPSTVFVLPF